jgi:hypothetical protein
MDCFGLSRFCDTIIDQCAQPLLFPAWVQQDYLNSGGSYAE